MQISPPKNWTQDPDELKTDFYWENDDSKGRVFAKDHGLNSPKPAMCSTRESGDCLYMFQSGSNYYIWNQIESTVWRIKELLDLEEIVSTINKLDVEGLSIEEVPSV